MEVQPPMQPMPANATNASSLCNQCQPMPAMQCKPSSASSQYQYSAANASKCSLEWSAYGRPGAAAVQLQLYTSLFSAYSKPIQCYTALLSWCLCCHCCYCHCCLCFWCCHAVIPPGFVVNVVNVVTAIATL